MGRLAVMAMIEEASPGLALRWHMRANLYPAPPASMVPVAERAIEHGQAGNLDAEIDLPDGVRHRSGSTTATARQVIESFHLEAFVEPVDDEL